MMTKYFSAIAGFLLFTASLTAQTFDLNSEWSDVANPNGVWRYRQATTNLPSGTWGFDFTSQPAWLGGNPAVWLKTQSTAGFDVQVGDVVTHSANGAAGLTNIVWTSPSAGTIDINGGVWMIRDIGRANDWIVRLNGTLLSTGSLSSGDAFNRANPFNLDSGSGGALNALSVVAGDQVELSFQQVGGTGDYVGVNFAVSLSAVPEPTTLALGCMTMGLAGGAVLLRRKKNRSAARKKNRRVRLR